VTIQDKAKYWESQVDWAILDGCFPGRISPSDVDGMVEIGGRVLFLEHKLPGSEIKDGQRIAFKALSRLGATVIAFHSAEPHDRIEEIRVWQAGIFTKYEDEPLDFLRELVADWAAGQ